MNNSIKIIVSSVIGNILENYDYVLYATFAVVIGKTFLSIEDPYLAMLATFAIFAAGFITRPIGAIIFGHIGDKHSRKLALSVSIMLMSFPTTIIGLLPSYEQIGILAPIALVLIRFLQGISIGGETSGFMTYLMEAMPNSKRKNLIGSIAVSSTAIGLFFGFLASFICNFYFADISWAWRLPFLISLPVGLVGFYIRSKLEESVEFLEFKNKGKLYKMPFVELLKNYKKRFFIICGLFISISIPFYIFFGFMASFLSAILHYKPIEVSIIYLVCTTIFAIAALASGLLSDRFGAYKTMLIASLIFCILIFPIFTFIFSDNFLSTLFGCFCFIALAGLYQGSVPAVILKIFPTKIRSIGTAFSFNIVSVIFGGLTPLFLTFMIKVSSNYYVMPCYLILSFLITILAVRIARREDLL
jgi:MHS family proline/betaine transporter-like MFS transporter